MGKLLLWLKSLGAGNIPVYASVSLTLQVGVQTSQTQKVANSLEPIERIVTEVKESAPKRMKAIIKKNTEGSYFLDEEVFEEIDTPVQEVAEEEVLENSLTSLPQIARAIASAAASSAPPIAKSTSGGNASSGSIGGRALGSGPKIFTNSSKPNSGPRPISIEEAPVKANSNGSVAAAGAAKKEKTPLDRADSTSSKTSIENEVVDSGITSGGDAPRIPNGDLQNIFTGTSSQTNMIETDLEVPALDNVLYIAIVAYRTATNSIIGLKGLGFTWNHIATQCAINNGRTIGVYYAHGKFGTSSKVVAGFSASSPSNSLVVGTISNVDLSSSFVLGVRTANSLGLDGTGDCTLTGPGEESYNYKLSSSEVGSTIITATSWGGMGKTHNAISFTEKVDITGFDLSDGRPTHLVVGEYDASAPISHELKGTFSTNTRWSSVSVEFRLLP
ncbi:MAG: hypothetical protein CME70_20060 [Halobacteriovorax sp.]|nr:hypothetical protein [Halobacteriovorax sp.]|tara:strand:- start:79181 stop:80515 length:1335 start_codon:yes stop_codon:yes gene_type:complete